ncbi:hypothetical protein GGU10DRAFT_353287 [Lentinula aff. detonsa]|uniref:Uncharacterized protein n=1 Tax=Lentinula aff. detonsa TaxID=2804958 RepID=A0AA38NM50_9AGAR|nr:hypothetical protein GGU10DRAFT_353287 [Lentinula aff. detonsa]
MLSLTRLLPTLLLLLVSILVVNVTAAPTVNDNKLSSGKQLVSFMLSSTNRLQPLPLEKYDGTWRSPSTLDVGIRIGTNTIPYYASRDSFGGILIERGTNRVTGQPKISRSRSSRWSHLRNGSRWGRTRSNIGLQFGMIFSNFQYSSKSEFLEQGLGEVEHWQRG